MPTVRRDPDEWARWERRRRRLAARIDRMAVELRELAAEAARSGAYRDPWAAWGHRDSVLLLAENFERWATRLRRTGRRPAG